MRWSQAILGAMISGMMSFSPSAWAEDGWLAEDVESQRFTDAPTPGPTFRKGLKVEVLTRKAGKVRIMAGTRIGWVAPEMVLADDPAAPAPAVPTAD